MAARGALVGKKEDILGTFMNRVACRGEQYSDEGELEHLAQMLWYADQAYEGESERTLSKRLEKRGALTL